MVASTSSTTTVEWLKYHKLEDWMFGRSKVAMNADIPEASH